MPERKSVRLLKYFNEITEITSRPVRNIDNYEQVLWLKDIPRDVPKEYCFTRAWEWETDDGANNTDDGTDNDDTWIQVKKWPEPLRPRTPSKLRDWIDKETLGSDTAIPKLLQSIKVEENNPEWEENNEEIPNDEMPEKIISTKYLRGYPEIHNTWDHWISNKWIPWSKLHKKWEEKSKLVDDIYSKLFSIHQMQLKLGEEYELVLGIGLLQWRINDNYSCKRHILVANARIDFNSKERKFVIAPMEESLTNETVISNEFDMLKHEDQPPPHIVTEVKESLQNCDELWEKPDIEPLLRTIAHTLGEGNGECQDDNLEISNLNERRNRPLIDFAPALILRKRNTKDIKEIINSISKQVQQNGHIPQLFSALSEEQNEDAGQDNPLQDDTAENNINYPNNGMAYFPSPSNNEQDKILQLAKFNQGVLVQGPPGTGKSHAVANLICHFLATGKRILITAQKPRALKVLKDKLPDLIKPLCINLLDQNDRQSLENSVKGILSNQYQDTDEPTFNKEIEEVSEKLDELKRRQSVLERDIQDRRIDEREPRTIEGAYHGTLANIAKRVNEEEEKYSWFTDNPPLDTTDPSCPFQTNKLINLWQSLQEITDQEREELALEVPRESEENCPAAQKFSTLVKEERQNNEVFETDLYQILLDADDVEATKNIIENIHQLNRSIENVQNIRNIPAPEIERIVSDILFGENERWKYLFKNLPDEGKIEELKEKSDLFENIDFEFPDDIKRKELLADVQNRYDHFKNGGKRLFWLQVVRETRYIEKSVKIDSQECKSQESLEKVIDYLKLQQEISGYWSLLERTLNHEIADQAETPLSLQIIKIKEWRKKLEKILELCEVREEANDVIARFAGIGEIAWHDEEAVSKLLVVCRHYISEKAKQKINKTQEYLENLIDQENSCHPSTKDLYEAVINRDISQYDSTLNEINDFIKEQSRVRELDDKLNNIRSGYPSLATMIEENSEQDIEEKIYQIENAWKWAKAKSWLEDYSNRDIRTLERELKEKTGAIQKQIKKLASLKAWASFSIRSQEIPKFKSHLEAFLDAMRRYGRGTGRHARKHLRDAQKHFSHCKYAIPAWVMPLYRVYQTVERTPERFERFDLIIVDEASQCNLESFLLTYMGKQLIIVGDDQQISPQAVGVDIDDAFHLRHEYLYDFEQPDLFLPDSSLFDYGRRMFGRQKVVLREHFRCMPEIIRFSNKLCYATNPLIPLRQYPPERLEPLKPIFVRDGYTTGTGTGIYNKPEAEEIVKKIVECCKDPQYEDKTMGVISLQGTGQAKLIEKLLLNRLGAEQIEDRGLICGNADSFQGDERDIIFLSMVAKNPRALTSEADKRRFNVAASRAKDQMWLAHTVGIDDINNPHCFRRKLLEHFYNRQAANGSEDSINWEELRQIEHEPNHVHGNQPEPFDSWFELRVALMIKNKGYDVIPQYPFAGYKIDLVIEGGQSRLAVECDGDYWHGPERYGEDMQRQRQLERCDWHFCRIKEWMFYHDRESVWEELEKKLKARNINPIDFVAENNPNAEHHTQQTTDNATANENNTNRTTRDINPIDAVAEDNPNAEHHTQQRTDNGTANENIFRRAHEDSLIEQQRTDNSAANENNTNRTRRRRGNFNFTMLGIPQGAELKFKDHEEVTCRVFNHNKVIFRGEKTFLSTVCKIVFEEMGYGCINGRATNWWLYKGRTLDELREQREQNED